VTDQQWHTSAAAVLGVQPARLAALNLTREERDAIDQTPIRTIATIAAIVRQALAADTRTEAAA
jgi:hypothetical protein